MHSDEMSDKRGFARAATVLPRWKRAVDVAGCCAALPLLVLLTFVFGLIAAFVAKGPVFFRQETLGCQGRRIRLYRFRTMRERVFATDERTLRKGRMLIPGGWFLRATGLADLPQIINVLVGEMSIVGPRPVQDDDFVMMNAGHANALPGLTGPWRLAEIRASGDPEALQWSLDYARAKSLTADCAMILRTIPAVCASALSVRKSRLAGGAHTDAAAASASLRTPSQQPW